MGTSTRLRTDRYKIRRAPAGLVPTAGGTIAKPTTTTQPGRITGGRTLGRVREQGAPTGTGITPTRTGGRIVSGPGSRIGTTGTSGTRTLSPQREGTIKPGGSRYGNTGNSSFPSGGVIRQGKPTGSKPNYGGTGLIRPSHNRGSGATPFGYYGGKYGGYYGGYWYGSPYRSRWCSSAWWWLDCWWWPASYAWYHTYGFYPSYYARYDDRYYDDDDDITIIIQNNDPIEVEVEEPVGEALADAPPPINSAGRVSSRYATTASESYIRLGDQAFLDGRYTDAVQLYAKAVEFQPQQADLYLVLSDALFAAGDYHYAAYTIRRALELDPNLAFVVLDKHTFYTDPGEFDHQLTTLEGYLIDHPTDRDARLVLATNFLFGARPDSAVALLESSRAETLAEDAAAVAILEAARIASR